MKNILFEISIANKDEKNKIKNYNYIAKIIYEKGIKRIIKKRNYNINKYNYFITNNIYKYNFYIII
jgi:hypothetical protein